MLAVSATMHLAYSCTTLLALKILALGSIWKLILLIPVLKLSWELQETFGSISHVFLKALHFGGEGKYCRNFCVTCFNLM